jgi:hypothetical protein
MMRRALLLFGFAFLLLPSTASAVTGSEFNALKARVATLETKVAALQAEIPPIESRLSALESPPVEEPPPATSILWGAWMDGSTYGSLGDAPWTAETWNLFESHAGKKVDIVHWGQPWGALDTTALGLVKGRGAVSLIDMGIGSTTLQAIAEGQQNAVIDAWAQKAKTFGSEILFRPWWEMNGNWFAWGRSEHYVAAWKLLYTRVKAIAPNVKFVWCPNVQYDATSTEWIDKTWPGEAYVDWTCMDGYNGGPLKNSTWITPPNLFNATYQHLLSLAPNKPIMIGETASNEQGAPSGTSKAAWITELLGSWLPSHAGVKAMVYFNWPIPENGTTMEWPIESSPAAQEAFKAGIASSYYKEG